MHVIIFMKMDIKKGPLGVSPPNGHVTDESLQRRFA